MMSKKPSLHRTQKHLSLLLAIVLCSSSILGQVAFAAPLTFDEYQSPILNSEVYKPVLPSKTSSPLAPGNISADAFENIQLDTPLPNTFYQKETYLIKGRITHNPNKETELFAFLNYIDTNNQENFINFSAPIINNAFSIPLHLSQTGNYQLGIVLGNSGKSKIREIHVSTITGETKSTPKNATGLKRMKLTYDENQDTTSLTWKRTGSDWYHITFQQDQQSINYIVRQNVKTIPLNYNDFRLFKPGNITVTLATRTPNSSGPWLNLLKQKMQITYHGFKEVENKEINITKKTPSTLKWKAPIIIQGLALQSIQGVASITQPNGNVINVPLKSNGAEKKDIHDTIFSGKNIELTYHPQTSGRHIVEINNTSGGAAINMPFYVMTGTPLIPDFHDLLEELSPQNQAINLVQDQQKMLEMINAVRTGTGLSPVTLNSELNNLAQNHSNDMVQRNFFGHVNPSGETPDDRRKKANYSNNVSENLANAETLLSCMQGLLRSPLHRENILNPLWTRVGIGIAASNDGTIKVTQVFSGEPLTTNTLSSLKNSILTSFNTERKAQGNTTLTEDATLLQIANSWSQKLAQLNTFGLKTSDGSSLAQMVQDADLQSNTQMFIFSTNSTQDIASRIFTESDTNNGEWKRIGLGLSSTKLGELKITILLSK